MMKKGCVVCLVMLVAWLNSATAVLHKVGGKAGWTPNDVNYTQWAAHERFYVGEWLYFVYDKHYYSVLEVNKTSYEECDDHGFIKNVTRGGRDVFNLTEAGAYYFISSGGYCFHGMKLAINVSEVPLATYSAPAPSSKSDSPGGLARTRSHIITPIFIMLVMAIICSFFFEIC